MENEKIIDLLKKSINKKLLYTILILILIPLVLLFASKLTPKNRSISKLNNFKNEINECNETLKSAINDSSINTTDAMDILANGILTLDNIKDSVSNTSMPASISDLNSSFKKTLDYNISLYEISLSILKDPKSKELSSKYNSLNNTLDLFSECSNNLNQLGINYNLNSNGKIFFSNIKNYSNAIIKLNRDTDIVTSQKREFLMEIEKCLSLFDNLKQDLKPAIDKIHSDGRSLTGIIDDINTKKSLLDSLRKNVISLTVAPVGKDAFSCLEDSLTSYNIYISSLEKAVVLDSSTDKNSDNSKSASLYMGAYDKYNDFLNTFTRLKEQVSLLKK